jgi:hypothetical protein
MDSLVAAAARLLAAGDPLGALKRVALRDDSPALALRGIAMAQLGDYERSRQLLRRAARGFGSHERLAQARCHVAEAEVALAARDLTRRTDQLNTAIRTLDSLGDRANGSLRTRPCSGRSLAERREPRTVDRARVPGPCRQRITPGAPPRRTRPSTSDPASACQY